MAQPPTDPPADSRPWGGATRGRRAPGAPSTAPTRGHQRLQPVLEEWRAQGDLAGMEIDRPRRPSAAAAATPSARGCGRLDAVVASVDGCQVLGVGEDPE